MNKKLISKIIAGSVVFLIMLTGGVVGIIEEGLKTDAVITPEEPPIETVLPSEEADAKNDYNEVLSNGEGVEVTEAKGEQIIMQYLNTASTFEFLEANEVLQRALTSYDINDLDNSERINQLYEESAMMCHYPSMIENDTERTLESIRAVVKDPYNHFVTCMWLESKYRERFIWDAKSMNPEFYGGITIEAINEVEASHEYFQACSRAYSDMSKMYQFDFKIGEHALFGYVAERTNGNPIFFRIDEQVEGSTYYKTIEEWREMKNNR